MKLTNEQSLLLRQQALDDFHNRAVAHMREQFPTEVSAFSDTHLKARVTQCIARADKYGLTTQKQIICFLDITLLLGDNFESNSQHDDLVALLRSKDIEPTERAGFALGMAYCRSRQPDDKGQST